MIRFLAVDFNQSPAAAVVARIHRERPIEIVSIGSLKLQNAVEQNDEVEDVQAPIVELELSLPDGGIDRTLAVISNQELVYASLDLPFNDPKKIAQVVPLQLQDSLPFDISDCVLDTTVTKSPEENSYRVLAALSSSKTIESSLASMNSIGFDPTTLSTHSATLAELYHATLSVHGAQAESGMIALVNIQSTFVALVILLDGESVFFREWNYNDSQVSSSATLSEIKTTIAAAEISREAKCHTVYVLGSNEMLNLAQSTFEQKVEMLNLDGLVENHTEQTLALDKYSWAIALAAREKLQSSLAVSSFNFRKGKYAYQRAWGSVFEALAKQATYIVLFVLLCLGYCLVDWWATHKELQTVEKEIAKITKLANVEGVIPHGSEISFFETANEEIELQLQEMGSLASLSPLESLRLLSTIITPNIQVEVDSITIGFSRVLLRGTVEDTPTLGRLETALKGPSKQFCAVKVDPTGREGSSSRQRFSAEIDVCD